jgi:DNA-binding CsgD family transcriptional regulator
VLAHVVQNHVGSWRGDERPTLGRREIQCLKLAAEGLKAKQIASALGIGQQTVQFHLSRAREKLNCSNTVQAVARAAQFGLLPDSVPIVVAED